MIVYSKFYHSDEIIKAIRIIDFIFIFIINIFIKDINNAI